MIMTLLVETITFSVHLGNRGEKNNTYNEKGNETHLFNENP